MTTELERAKRALQAASAAADAGDVGAADQARQLAGYIRQMTGQQAPRPDFGRGLAQSIAQGATFGFADEIVGAGKAVMNREPGEAFGQAYTRHRDSERDRLEAFAEAYPKTSFAGELAGGLLVPGTAAYRAARFKMHATPTVGKMAVRGAAAGAASGAAFGAGKAEEMKDVPVQAALGGTLGGAVGAAIPAGVEMAKRAIGLVPRSAAQRRVAQAIGRDDMTPSQIEARVQRGQDLGRPVSRADVGGPALARELEAVAQQPGRGSSLIERTLTERNKGQLNRVSNDLMRATGVQRSTILSEISDVMERRATAAMPLYERAMAFPAEQTPELVGLYNRMAALPLGRQALPKAKRILNVENFDEAPLMARIDALKQGLDDTVGAAKRAGEAGTARQGTIMSRKLTEAVDAINPDYAAARNAWAGPTRYLQAIDDGRGIMARNVPAEEMQAAFSRLSPSEQEGFRLGAVNALLTRMRQETAREPNLLKFIRSHEMKDKLAAIMPPRERERFFEVMDLEERMFDVASQALRGSQTAQRISAQREMSQSLMAQIVDLIAHPLEAVRSGAKSMFGRPPGLGERQGEAIAQTLLSPQAAGGARLPAPMIPHIPGTPAVGAAPVAIEPFTPGSSGRR